MKTLSHNYQSTVTSINSIPTTKPSLTSASIKQFFPQIGQEKVVATQTVFSDTGEIYSRSFESYDWTPLSGTQLILIPNPNPEVNSIYGNHSHYLQAVRNINKIKYDSIKDGDRDYSVITNRALLNNDFIRWQRRQIFLRWETHYKLNVSSTLTWERPISNAGPPIVYSTLTNPFIRTINCNGALVATISTNANNYTITAVNGLLEKPVVNIGGYILLDFPQLKITINNPTATLPTFITINFLGVEVFNQLQPLNTEVLPALIHPTETEYEDRLLPPGQSFPTNFWNSDMSQYPILISRTGGEPTWN
jgi:hypothetical protein